MKLFKIVQMDKLEAVPCPCGMTRRAFRDVEGAVATLHMADISIDSRAHYHKKLSEIYLVLEGYGQMELDGELFDVGPLSAIYIKPGCRHRAIGDMRIVNIPVPAFDPNDEWFDEGEHS